MQNDQHQIYSSALPVLHSNLLPSATGRSSPSRTGTESAVLTSPSWKSFALCSSASAREHLPLEKALQYKALPLSVVSSNDSPCEALLILTPVSCTAETLAALKFITGFEILTESAEPEIIERAIHAAYLGSEQNLSSAVTRANVELETAKRVAFSEQGVQEQVGTIPDLLRAILNRALALQASDIHIEPQQTSVRLRFRINGLLEEDSEIGLTRATAEDLSRRIKVLSNIEITSLRRPLEGGFTFSSNTCSIRLRVSTVPHIHGEKIVLRLLEHRQDTGNTRASHQSSLSFSALGLSAEEELRFKSFLGASEGTIVLSGPTGSGKSTLLYTALQHLNAPERNIVTIEDPVERMLPGITQIEVDRARNLDYLDLLRPLLRQDPDVVMLGEIREKSTAEVALTAGVTGHLVLCTVHSGNCLEILSRFMQWQVHPMLLASTLRLLVSQRLLGTNCIHCQEEITPNTSLQRIFAFNSDATLFASRGCMHCRNTGISGRIGVFEWLPISEPLRNLFAQLLHSHSFEGGGFYTELKKAASLTGYQPYSFRVRELLASGIVDPKTALTCLGIAPSVVGY